MDVPYMPIVMERYLSPNRYHRLTKVSEQFQKGYGNNCML